MKPIASNQALLMIILPSLDTDLTESLTATSAGGAFDNYCQKDCPTLARQIRQLPCMFSVPSFCSTMKRASQHTARLLGFGLRSFGWCRLPSITCYSKSYFTSKLTLFLIIRFLIKIVNINWSTALDYLEE